MTSYFIIPDLGDSGMDHWQTYFENSGANFKRIIQKEWDATLCTDWVTTVEKSISMYDHAKVVLLGHSLDCATVAHWARQYQKKIRGTLLVAPSDIKNPVYTFPAMEFNPIPKEKINFKTIVVARSNDPWGPLKRAKYFADRLGSEFLDIGEAGHINAAFDHGEWKEGLAILKKLN